MANFDSSDSNSDQEERRTSDRSPWFALDSLLIKKCRALIEESLSLVEESRALRAELRSNIARFRKAAEESRDIGEHSWRIRAETAELKSLARRLMEFSRWPFLPWR